MDTGEQEPGPRSIALPLAMAAVAILLLGWALLASQDAAEAQEITENTPTAHPPSPSGGGGASGQASLTATPTPHPPTGDGVTGRSHLPTPTGLTGTPGTRSISLDWNDVAGATEYEVQQWDGHVSPPRWRTLPFNSNRNFTIRFSGSSAVVGGLLDGTSYAHAVRAKNGGSRSSWTPSITTSTILPPPTAFTGTSGRRSISLDWNNVAGATRYEVRQWDGHVSPPRWRTLPFIGNRNFTIGFSGSSAVVGGLLDGTNYAHAVRSYNGNVYSAWTSHITTDTLPKEGATSTPTATSTATPTPTPTATSTATPTPTPTATSTPTATRTPRSTNPWTTMIFSGKRNEEYGYSSPAIDELGGIKDTEFKHGGVFRIDFLVWDGNENLIEFQLHRCLMPSKLKSLKLGSRKFTSKVSSRKTDRECRTRPDFIQKFKFRTSSNPLPRNEWTDVELSFKGGSVSTATPTPNHTATKTPTPVPTPASLATVTHTPVGATPTHTATPDCSSSSQSRGSGASGASQECTVATPEAPTNLTRTYSGDGQITLEWQAPANGSGLKYEIWQRMSTVYNVWSKWTSNVVTNVRHVATGLIPGTTYEHKVRSIKQLPLSNATVTSEWSTPVTTQLLNVNVGLTVISNRDSNPSTPFADFKWQILDSAKVQADFPAGVTPGEYEYRVLAPYGTGIQVNRSVCNWSANSSNWPDKSSWTYGGNITHGVTLIRCRRGDERTKLTVQLRNRNDRGNIDYDSYSTVVRSPWHVPDNGLSYFYRGPRVPSDGLPQSVIDGYIAAADRGAAKWNTALGSGRSFSFSKVARVSDADVVVEGYPSSGTDRCNGAAAVACVPYTASTYPDITLRQTLYFEYPPVSVIPASKDPITGNTTPARTVTYDWENDFTISQRNSRLLYLPIYIAHEFGHAAGLWHSPGVSDAMTSRIASNTQNINSNDKSAMKALYDGHTAH